MAHTANNSTAMASVKGHDGKKIVPVLSAGALCLGIVQEWQAKANAFFSKQKIPAESQISEILNSFKDQQIISWIANNRETLTTEQYNFALFMKEFCALFLDLDWEYDIVCSVLNAKMNSKNSFSVYTEHIITGNNLLRGTESCLDDAGLKNTLTMNMTDSLASHIRCLPEAECTCLSDLKFELCVPAITRINNTLSGQKRQMEEIAQNLLNKHPKTEKQPAMYDNNENQQRPYASGANATSRGYQNRHSDQNQRPQQLQNRGGFSDRNNKCERRCPF